MRNSLYIIGAGSVGGHLAANPHLYNMNYDSIVFLDDDPEKINTEYVGCRVEASTDYLLSIDFHCDVVIGIAFPGIKQKVYNRFKNNLRLNFISLVASNAWISNNVSLGIGCIIYPHTSINYGSVIEDFVVINMNCALGHHARVGKFSSLAPGVSFGGHTHIGRGVDVGIGASTVQRVTIGDGSIIGGQAMITQSFGSDSRIVGVPGRNLNEQGTN